MFQPAHRLDLWAVATSWLIAHASFHLWEVAGLIVPTQGRPLPWLVHPMW